MLPPCLAKNNIPSGNVAGRLECLKDCLLKQLQGKLQDCHVIMSLRNCQVSVSKKRCALGLFGHCISVAVKCRS